MPIQTRKECSLFTSFALESAELNMDDKEDNYIGGPQKCKGDKEEQATTV